MEESHPGRTAFLITVPPVPDNHHPKVCKEKSRELRVYVGNYAHSESMDAPLVCIPNCVIGVENGKILFVDKKSSLGSLKQMHKFGNDKIRWLGSSEFLMPGFIDVHIHCAQCLNAGLGVVGHEAELRECLKNFTVDSEINFKDPVLTRACYKDIVKSTLNYGITTATYFASVYQESCEILADICEELGQRAFIGKQCTNMVSPNLDETKDPLSLSTESTADCLASAEQFVQNTLARQSTLVQPIISPKSALSCTEDLLQGLGKIASKYNVHIQSHLCESEEENIRVLEHFPQYKNYTQIYEQTGMLTNKSVMAHCIHMTEEEINVLSKCGTSVAHCPTSNILHERGLCPVRKFWSMGIKVGLGTNVSAAFSASMLQTIRHAILTSKIIRIINFENKPLSFGDAFYLATLGGAEVLSIQDTTGNFEVGKSFDALKINTSSIGSAISLLNRESLEEKVQKFLMLGDQANIYAVYVQGRKVSHNLDRKRFCKIL